MDDDKLMAKPVEDLTLGTGEYYLDCLPEHILIRICSYLTVADQCSLNETSDMFGYVTSTQQLTSHIDLVQQYTCEKSALVSYFNRCRCANIVSLNLNHCYWAPSDVLSKVISLCVNLRELHILQVNTRHQAVYNKFPQLSALSWSVDFAHFQSLCNHPSEECYWDDKFGEIRRFTIDVSDKHIGDAEILHHILTQCKLNLRSLTLITFNNHIRRFTALQSTLAYMVKEMRNLSYLYIDKKLIFKDGELLQELYYSDIRMKSLLVVLNVQFHTNEFIENNVVDRFNGICGEREVGSGNEQKPSVVQNLDHFSLRLSARDGANELFRHRLLTQPLPCYSWTYLYVEERIHRHLSHFLDICAPRLAKLRTLRYLTLSLHSHDFSFLYQVPQLTKVNLTGYNFAPHQYNASHVSLSLPIHDVCNALMLMPDLDELSLPACALSCDEHVDDQLSESASHTEVYCAGRYMGRVLQPNSTNAQSKMLRLTKSCPNVKRFELINVTFWSAFDSRVYESYNIKSCEPCPKTNLVNASDLRYLYRWKRLEYLSLAGLPSVHQLDFLYNVAKHCTELTSMSLSHIGNMDYSKCTYSPSLIKALPLFKNLKDLRIEQNNLTLDSDFFTTIQRCKSLQRLVIITSRVVRIGDPYQLVEVVKNLECLIFFLLFSGMSYDLCRSVQVEIVKRCKPNGCRAALGVFLLNNFIMERQSLLMSKYYQIPSCHQHNVMYFASRTCLTPNVPSAKCI